MPACILGNLLLYLFSVKLELMEAFMPEAPRLIDRFQYHSFPVQLFNYDSQ